MDNIGLSDKCSFWELINQNEIQIPIIQRDYAQGRIEKVKLRKDLLTTFKYALRGEPANLDFVYGSIEDGKLWPLDGQQRLTTLFLLHWYIARKEGRQDEGILNKLARFSYRTRISSRDFCRDLVLKGILIPAAGKKISLLIRDANWYVSSWDKDPTISAMLNMLDDIHHNFAEEEEVWDILTDADSKPIAFHFLELEKFGLSDDLYIKMNARGLQLSPFENFKADFNSHISKMDWENGIVVEERFGHKTDTVWTDIFWNHGHGEKTFDTHYLNFINNALLTEKRNKSDEAILERLLRSATELLPSDIKLEDFVRLKNMLNIYTNEDNRNITYDFPLWHIQPTADRLFDLMLEKPTYAQRVFFYAQSLYLLAHNGPSKEGLSDWMRVTRNIILNSTIDTVATFTGALNLIGEISKGSSNIYEYLATNSINSGFAAAQVKEEVLKAKLIDDSNFKDFYALEDTAFGRGKIEFALYCIQEGEQFVFHRLPAIKSVYDEHFSQGDVSNAFRRAMLTIGDHKFYHNWRTWVYAISQPKFCLIDGINDLRLYSSNYGFRHYLKSLVNKLCIVGVEVVINEWVNKPDKEELPQWKNRLITEPKLLDKYCPSHYIAISNEEDRCWLLKIGRPRDKSQCHKI